MAGFEKRLARAVFTKKLLKICQALDTQDTREVVFKDLFGRNCSSTIRITNLWIVGSYARGAAQCGDLDLVIATELCDGNHPRPSDIKRAFFGSHAYVSVYTGSPAKNSSGAVFPEGDAILVWSGLGCNWQETLDAIVVDKRAGRADREIDSIPFRPDQLACEHEFLLELLQQREAGIVEWEMLPMPREAVYCESLIASLPRAVYDLGQKTQALLPAVLDALKVHEPHGEWTFGGTISRNVRKIGGTLVLMGRPDVPMHLLNERLGVRQLMVVPHISARGPNGIWLLRHGPKSPIVSALTGKRAYYLNCDGRPLIFEWDPEGGQSYIRHVKTIELFTNKRAANRAASKNEAGHVAPIEVALATGPEILAIAGLAEAVMVGDELLPCWPRARYHDADAVGSTFHALAKLLPNC